MRNSNNDIEELEELLTELEGQEAQLVTPYSEDDDAVTRLMDAPLGEQEWMVQVTALDRRMMSVEQLTAELQGGRLGPQTLVWRGGMADWLPIARVEELARATRAPLSSVPRQSRSSFTPPPVSMSPASVPPVPASLPPPPAPLPPPPAWASSPASALPPPPAPLPPPPPTTMGMARPVSALPPPPREPQTGTTRPVALDFSDLPPPSAAPLQGKRIVMALSAAAILAGFATLYSVFGGSEKPSADATKTSPEPRAVAALQPVAPERDMAKKDKAAESAPRAGAIKPAEPTDEPRTAAVKNEDEKEAKDEDSSESSVSARATNAPARYMPRSESRRRGRSSSDSSDAKPSAAATSSMAAIAEPTPPRSSAPAEEEPSNEVAAAPADDDADAVEAPRSTSKNTFNREAAKAALDEAAAQAKNCRPQGGPSGTGRVQVRYEPSGKVAAVSILTSKFENTTTGSCVRMLFRRAKVPEFTGAPVVVVNKSFEIP